MNKDKIILVVDDFSTMRKIIRGILKELKYNTILEADDGTTAWEMLQKHRVDLIISDWNMPAMSGIKFLRTVRSSEEFYDIPFIMVTAEGLKENVVEAIQAGVSGYIVKPFTAATLEAKMDDAFSK
ncbi:response regulator [Desulfonatronovibrio magnus]|uniref:response regulator n=1 Tax=Desulfonatronovibrio magnus TaxID=698827 RepID=UPI0005EBD78D|nr:response regulator [Desulfonatronovibrio magnus]